MQKKLRKWSLVLLSSAMAFGIAGGLVAQKIVDPFVSANAATEKTVVFKDNDKDGTASFGNVTQLKAQIESGSDYVTGATDIAYVYYGITGLKMSSTKNAGKFTINVESIQLSKVIINASRWKSTEAASLKVKVGTNEVTKSLTESFANYECVFDGSAVTQLTFTAVKRVYFKSFTLVDEAGGEVEVPDLTSLDISGELNRNKYYVGQPFLYDGLIATATFSDNSTRDVTNYATWTASPATATSTSITSVTFNVSYEENGILKSNSVTKNVTVADGIIYDFETNNSSWFTWNNSYTKRTVTHTNVGQSTAATIQFEFASKQSSGVGSTYPCIAYKVDSETKALTFTLEESGKVIESVELDLVNRGSPELWLHKGDSIAADTVLDHVNIQSSDTELTLSTDNLNDTVFTLGYKGATGSNKQVGLRSIVITVADQESFGTLDHIKVTSLPNKTVYATGERFSSEGLVVTAYDNADESKANFKDVTEDIEFLTDDGYYFQFSDMPGYDSEIYYTENGITVETSFYIEVVLGARYRRVEKNHSQWDGTYLIVVEKAEGEHIAFNPSGDLVDSVGNYVDVEVDDWNNIDAPAYLQVQIETIEGGYSLKTANGQYIGHNNNSNGLSTSTSQTTFVNSITYDEEAVGVVISNNQSTSRSLDYNSAANADRFRYYSGDNVVQLYERVASQGADDWGEMFLGLLDCDPDGLTPPSVKDWNDLAEMYLDTENGDLGDEDWYIYRTALPNPSPDAQVAEQVAARYDYILAKYGTDTYQNFMNREVPEFAANPLTNQMILKQQQTTTVIVTFATLALVTIGGYGYIRLAKKRKDN